MTDLDAELRRGFAAVVPGGGSADELLPEFRRRLGRRRRRRSGGAAAVVVLLVAVAVGLTTREAPETAEPVAPPSTTTSIVTVPPGVEVGAALRPGEVALPVEGVAVEVPSVGLVLVGLDGRVLGHLPGMGFDAEAPNGPLVVHGGGRRYVLADGGMREAGEWMVPLAYGAELVKVGQADPGRFVVRRDGRQLFEVSNNMDGVRAVSYDRDFVTNLWDTYSEAWDLRTGRTRKHPAGCWVADRHGSREYVVCNMPVTVRVGDDEVVKPLAGVGHWRSLMVSPDGGHLLLEWSGECEAPMAVLTPATGGQVTKPFGDATVAPLGWAADGRFLVAATGEPGCGATMVDPGIYAVTADGAKARVYAGTGFRAAMWSPALR